MARADLPAIRTQVGLGVDVTHNRNAVPSVAIGYEMSFGDNLVSTLHAGWLNLGDDHGIVYEPYGSIEYVGATVSVQMPLFSSAASLRVGPGAFLLLYYWKAWELVPERTIPADGPFVGFAPGADLEVSIPVYANRLRIVGTGRAARNLNSDNEFWFCSALVGASLRL